MNAPNDTLLIARVIELHDKQAFGMLVMRHQSAIRRFFLNQTLGNQPLSDDLAQDTFIKAYTNIDKFRGSSAFSTWLYRIAYNVFYDHTRSNHPTADINTPAVIRCNATTSEAGLALDIYSALKILTATERTCITLQLMEGQTIEHIAQITGMAQGTVKSHLFRGKEKLTIYLKQNGYDRKG